MIRLRLTSTRREGGTFQHLPAPSTTFQDLLYTFREGEVENHGSFKCRMQSAELREFLPPRKSQGYSYGYVPKAKVIK